MTAPTTEVLPANLQQPRSTEVADAVAWVRAALQGKAATSMSARFKALDHLSRCFDLTPADEDCLLFALAHRIDGSIAGLCAEAAGDPRHTYVTAHLLARTLGGDDTEFAASLFDRLAPGAPLRQWALVEMRETHALAAITLAEDVALRLSGAQDSRPLSQFSELPPAPPLDCISQRAPSLAPRMGQGLALIGPAGSGRRALVRAMADCTGQRPVLLERAALPETRAARETVLRALAREARLDGLIVALDADQDDQSRQFTAAEEAEITARNRAEGRHLATEVCGIFDGGLVILAHTPTGLPQGLHLEMLGALDAQERLVLWRYELGPTVGASEVEAVAQHFPLGPSEIAEIAERDRSERAARNALAALPQSRWPGIGGAGPAHRATLRLERSDFARYGPLRTARRR